MISTQPWDGATLAMLCTWLINLPLVPCVPAVMVVNVFCYRTYSNSLNLELMRLSRWRSTDWRLYIQCRKVPRKMKGFKKNARLHYIAFISHAKGKHMILQLLRSSLNNIAARPNNLHYCACVQFILLRGTDAAPAVWRTSDVFR